MNYDKILDRAMAVGAELHPGAPKEHHAAFANSVAYLVTGFSGGFGGPSMREHLAGRIGHAKGLVSNCAFEQAVEAVKVCCYGDLTVEHANMLEEHCFDDAPGEVAQTRSLLQQS